MSEMRTRHQKRARLAYEAVSRRKNQTNEKDYRSFALSFPALLHTCGLAQAAAFANAKKKHYLEVLEDVQFVMDFKKGSLSEKSRSAEFPDYVRLTREALAASSWVKRYAEALLNEPGDDDDEKPSET